MKKQEQVIEALRKQGHRLTPQRLLVLTIVAQGGGHMGVDEVFRQAKENHPYMDLATVYRTLHLFKRLGVVTEVAISDRLHYELTDPDGAHHHMVCQVCHGVYNLSPRYLDEFRDLLIREFGFEPDLHHFAITGVCANCRGINSTQNG
jgi:Fur family transcriptional regulator, ferric uptake regulator